MYRIAIESLEKWQKSEHRKPLVVKGARQVGKTWLVQHFGAKDYQNTIYINFDRDETAKAIFELDYDPERIITRLGLHSGENITAGETLIFLDEIQECPKALEALKYFCEEAPGFHIVVAGSLLGTHLHGDQSFPVGKVDFLDVYPMCFREFLMAIGEDKLADALAGDDFALFAPFHAKLIDYYKTYLVTGGMPEVVKTYTETKDLRAAREVQAKIVEAYTYDFSKHAPNSEVPRIGEIFDIVPKILAKENKKFMFGAIKESARAREYESAMLWLNGAGITSKVTRVNKVALPLAAYSDTNVFKLFYLDVGLLGYKAGLRPEAIIDESEFLQEFKGALAEQFVFQELTASGVKPYYYSKDDSRTELDFLVDSETGPLAIEVKAGESLASKSFAGFLRDNPSISGIKFSLLPYAKHEQMVNLPIYLAGGGFCGVVWRKIN